MPVRHNTGGEFPPGSGKKWLGVQFNNNDVLVNVYGGKYEDQNGKKRTQRFYGGRFKTMRPALESVIETLKKKVGCGKYETYAEKWGLKEKLKRAQCQIKLYAQEVTAKQEEDGLKKLNITSRKRKSKNSRLQSTHPKKHIVKKEFYVNTRSGTLSSGMYVVPKEESLSPTSIEPCRESNMNSSSSTTYVTPANMGNGISNAAFGHYHYGCGGQGEGGQQNFFKDSEIDEDIKFPLVLPPPSPPHDAYWGDADGGASEGSLSRSCSPFFTPPPSDMLYRDSASLGSFLPPKVAYSQNQFTKNEFVTRPSYDDDVDPFEHAFDLSVSPFESESSDVNMMEADDDDEDQVLDSLSERRQFCFHCRIQGVTCSACEQKDAAAISSFDFGSMNIFEYIEVDFLKNDDEFEKEAEETMDIEIKEEHYEKTPWDLFDVDLEL